MSNVSYSSPCNSISLSSSSGVHEKLRVQKESPTTDFFVVAAAEHNEGVTTPSSSEFAEPPLSSSSVPTPPDGKAEKLAADERSIQEEVLVGEASSVNCQVKKLINDKENVVVLNYSHALDKNVLARAKATLAITGEAVKSKQENIDQAKIDLETAKSVSKSVERKVFVGKVFGVVTAVGGGIALVIPQATMVAGVSNVWNPVGWLLLGGGLLILGGTLLFRYFEDSQNFSLIEDAEFALNLAEEQLSLAQREFDVATKAVANREDCIQKKCF